MHEITAVRMEHSPGRPYPHIAKVQLSDGTIETRDEIIVYIRECKMLYVTWTPSRGVPAARVIVTGCPTCGSDDYITTEPDHTEKNGLLDLPRF